ncbi:uncharacterized protein LOC115729420 [Rhodamnia argentea]|uniref:Uncharacterized protein LOC115729420 n=1 Tax=Rhodamnia argentea TaxID=178133 RepID=A0ABM3HUL4_9MYRT|nr:uncharacterized protein LOC115729420 [Rhodamnia argentea]
MSSNKRRAVEAAINRPDFMQWSAYPSDKASSYPLIPGQVRGELVSRPSRFLYMADSSLGAGGMSAGRKDFKNAHQGDASAHSHNLRETLKAKVNHVQDFENAVSEPVSNYLRKADEGRLLRSTDRNKYYGSFLSLGLPPQIKDGSDTPMDVIRNEGLDLRLTLGHNYEENIAPDRADEGPEHASGMAIADNRAIVDYTNYAHLSRVTNQLSTIELNAHQNKIPVYVIRNSVCKPHRTLDCNYKHKRNAAVFGGVKVTANYEAMVDYHNSAQSSGATSQVSTVEPNAHRSPESNSNPAGNAKTHETFRRELPNTIGERHPNVNLSSVHSLFSTGIFDGAPVKYILRRRNLLWLFIRHLTYGVPQIILHGVIKGPKILCSCRECNNSEYVTPYKFELHAGGRTKHPNACIYFENGKTVHGVFQQLRDTPEHMLFDAIPRIAGSADSDSLPLFMLWLHL